MVFALVLFALIAIELKYALTDIYFLKNTMGGGEGELNEKSENDVQLTFTAAKDYDFPAQSCRRA